MEKFLRNIFIFSLPAIFIIVSVIYIDFFKIRGFQDYYSNEKVTVNREVITTTTYNHYREKENFNSFIFGSSRSNAFKCKNWLTYLPKSSNPFHFDAFGEGIWGISKKIEYIDEMGDTIQNALLIIDRKTLTTTYPRTSPLFISMPCVSKDSKIYFYSVFLKASFNKKFLIDYIDYSIFKKHRSNMGNQILYSKYDHIVNRKNCDIWYAYDQEIKSDSLNYYNKLQKKGVWYERPKPNFSECNISNDEIIQLKIVKNVFKRHSTNFKIVISPIYDQIPLETEQLELLQRIFGKENIYNFSGKNEFTEPINNYYDTSHYKPHIANEIMRIIYNE